MNLRELTEAQAAILAQVENEDFTLEQVSDHLGLLEEDRNQKIENYLHVINRLQSEEITVTAEIDRLQDIRQQKEKAVSNMKDWLLMSMKDGEKHEFDLFKVSRVKGRETCQLIDSNKLPRKFTVYKPESWTPDKREILKELKAGKVVPGAELSVGKSFLRIK